MKAGLEKMEAYQEKIRGQDGDHDKDRPGKLRAKIKVGQAKMEPIKKG
jgi:hypothetical protein